MRGPLYGGPLPSLAEVTERFERMAARAAAPTLAKALHLDPKQVDAAGQLWVVLSNHPAQAAAVVPGGSYEPQTLAGRTAKTLGSLAPNALFPGSLGVRLASVAVPATTSSLAGETVRAFGGGAKAEQLARNVGAFAGGLAAGGSTRLGAASPAEIEALSARFRRAPPAERRRPHLRPACR